MKYKVDLAPRARKQLADFDKATQARVLRKLDELGDNPRLPGCKKLQGEHNLWRVRVGDYRIVFSIYDDVLLVIVARVAHRRDIYR